MKNEIEVKLNNDIYEYLSKNLILNNLNINYAPNYLFNNDNFIEIKSIVSFKDFLEKYDEEKEEIFNKIIFNLEKIVINYLKNESNIKSIIKGDWRSINCSINDIENDIIDMNSEFDDLQEGINPHLTFVNNYELIGMDGINKINLGLDLNFIIYHTSQFNVFKEKYNEGYGNDSVNMDDNPLIFDDIYNFESSFLDDSETIGWDKNHSPIKIYYKIRFISSNSIYKLIINYGIEKCRFFNVYYQMGFDLNNYK